MRTAFQVPFDASVRISLDTNLCMINERTKETIAGDRWYRGSNKHLYAIHTYINISLTYIHIHIHLRAYIDPSMRVPANEITRFPHGVLEVMYSCMYIHDILLPIVNMLPQ